MDTCRVKSEFAMRPSKPLYLISFDSSVCQGETESGLDFHEFCGRDWDTTINKRFGEWASGVFGGASHGVARGRLLTLTQIK